MRFVLPKIYPITDTRVSGLSHLEQVERLIDGGAELIQLRDKFASPREFYKDAARCVSIANGSGVRIIINDRVDIALALKTGVHLGQNDLPPEMARVILGPDAIIGYSTHTAEQATRATRFPIDYIAVGPVFPTQTKSDTDPVIGLEGIGMMRTLTAERPLVGIGGIDAANVGSVLAAGADSAAMIGAIVADPLSITQRMRRLIETVDR